MPVARGIHKLLLGECQLDPYPFPHKTHPLCHLNVSLIIPPFLFPFYPLPFQLTLLRPYPFSGLNLRIPTPSNNLTGPSCIAFVTYPQTLLSFSILSNRFPLPSFSRLPRYTFCSRACTTPHTHSTRIISGSLTLLTHQALPRKCQMG